jgi:hypothetical protein
MYRSLEDLWCSWGDATSAVMRHIEEKESVNSDSGWRFLKGSVRQGIGKNSGYSVTIFSTAYDSSIKQQLFLSVQANEDFEGKISVSTIKRCEVDEHLEKYL